MCTCAKLLNESSGSESPVSRLHHWLRVNSVVWQDSWLCLCTCGKGAVAIEVIGAGRYGDEIMMMMTEHLASWIVVVGL